MEFKQDPVLSAILGNNMMVDFISVSDCEILLPRLVGEDSYTFILASMV